jgi:hypothetical protein
VKALVTKLASQIRAELEEIIAKVWKGLDQKLLNPLLMGFILGLEILRKAPDEAFHGIGPRIQANQRRKMLQ